MNQLKNCVSCTALFIVLTLAGTASAQDHTPAAFGGVVSTLGGGGFGSGAAGPIGAGDLVEMSVFDTPELSGKLRVSNTGDVILPLVGSLHLQGLKAGEAQALIRQKLIDGGFLKDPQVTVFVAEYATQGVAILGEVKNPGIYPAFGSHHLLDYISVAQGLTPLAGTSITITHASKTDEPQRVKVMAGATPKPENNPEILPGDTIFVERTGLVYVVGDVARPGGFPMDHDGQLTISAGRRAGPGHESDRSQGIGQAHPHDAAGTPGNSRGFEEDSLFQGHRSGACRTTTFSLCQTAQPRARCMTFPAGCQAAAAAGIYRIP